MKRVAKKSCRHCGRLFHPHPKAAKVQKYCSRKACQRVRQRRKYRRWILEPAHRAAHQDCLRAWAKDYPNYWQYYRATHPNYVRQDNRRRALSLKRARCSAKQTDLRQTAVERLRAIQAMGTPSCSAKLTDLARRMDSLVEFLRWTVETPCPAKQTGMAWLGGTEG